MRAIKTYLEFAVVALLAYYLAAHYLEPVADFVGIPYVGN